jgi:hypothetical protein
MATLRLEVITPEIATAWRKLIYYENGSHPDGASYYHDEIRGGKWKPEMTRGQPIMFDLQGRVRSGASRMRAVVETGIAIQSWVARDVDYQPHKGWRHLGLQLENAIVEK